MNDDRTRVRSRDREVTDETWIRAVLRAAPVGVLATICDEWPFVQPNLFVYVEEESAIYLHTARTGRTRTNVDNSGRAAFTVFELGRLLPAVRAVDFSAEYASVVVFGRVSLVEAAAAKRVALSRWFAKYFPERSPGRDFTDFTDYEAEKVAVYRLEIEGWSAKRNQQPADRPGLTPAFQPLLGL